MKGSLYTLGYAAVLSAVCAFLLTGAAIFAKPRQQANADAEKMKNILHVLAVPVAEGMSAEALVKLFADKVTVQKIGELESYRYDPEPAAAGGQTIAVAFEGAGLWGPIKGFLALRADMRTINGITFYQQEETPGLGGEIASEGFLEQFAGKSVVGVNGEPGMVIKGEGSTLANQVDAISGATMTCDKVQTMLNDVIDKIVKEK